MEQDIVEIVQSGKPYLSYKHTVGGTVLEELDGNDVTLVKYTTDERGLLASSTLDEAHFGSRRIKVPKRVDMRTGARSIGESR